MLILAAITASMRRPAPPAAAAGVRRRARRRSLVSMVTWVAGADAAASLAQYGEKLEAVVGLVAIGVLLLITNWFFHKVYWSEWIAKFHRQRKALERLEKQGFISAQAIGLFVLGLTSVYREGFETVLFLQSLQLAPAPRTVLEGAGARAGDDVRASARVTFVLQRKLPYKKMLIVTGVLHRLRARRDGRPDRAHDAGHRLDADHADRRSTCRTGPGSGSASTRRWRRSAPRSPPPSS